MKFSNAFALFGFHVYWPDGTNIQYKYLNKVYFDCKIELCPDRQGKYIFTQESFYLPDILNDINQQDTSFLDCKHKHMMKSGAPPDKNRSPAPPVTYGIPSRIRLITPWFLVISQFF